MDTMDGPANKSRQQAMIVVSTVATAIGGIATILRTLGRCLVVRRLGWDDWLMMIGMACTAGYLFEILYGLRFGVGLHGSDINPKHLNSILQIVLCMELTYNLIVVIIKLSILCFYLRLVSVEGFFRTSCKVTIYLLVLSVVQAEIVTLAQCIPFRKIYDSTGTVKGSCINTTAYYYFLAVFNVIMDIWILVLPIKTLTKIKRPRREKFILYVVFGAGIFSCISGIVRLYTVGMFTRSKDPFYDAVPINIWSFVEINAGILCASVPAMKPLFTSGKHSIGTHSGSKPYSQRYRTHNSIPLSGTEPRPHLGDRADAHGFTIEAGGRTGSQERIVPTGIEYEREFSVQEHYIELSPTQKKKDDDLTDSS
ncbi:integral membrane protein [Xylogone sp. PMI_703]|nr:integral membrane protein [Xylogone sp. PMI_703]